MRPSTEALLHEQKRNDSSIPTHKYVFGTDVHEDEALRGKAWLRQEHWKWLFPFLFAGLGYWCMSVGLHWATYQYIHKYENAPEQCRTLYDSLEPNPAEKIDMKTIDMIAFSIPMCFVAMTAFAVNPMCHWGRRRNSSRSSSVSDGHPHHGFLLRQNVLRIWTKVMTCAMFLWMSKGILGAITLVPDSSGWNVCENRIKSAGTEWMRQEHSFSEMLFIDFIWIYEYRTPLRYCADMMFSGHTFGVTLSALGTYEMMRAFRLEEAICRPSNRAQRAIMKMSALTTFALLVIFEQIVEIWYVERSHFHYSSDVFMAIVLTFLIYTNGVIAVFAKLWTTWGFLIFFPRKTRDGSLSRGSKKTPIDVIVGAKVTVMSRSQNKRLCTIVDIEGDRVNIHYEGFDTRCDEWLPKDSERIIEWLRKDLELDKVWASTGIDDKRAFMTDPLDIEWTVLNSRGDIFIPPCCFPFCFYSGREHVYSDEGIMKIVQAFDKKNDDMKSNAILQYLQTTMLLDEGVSWDDFMSTMP